MKLSVILPCFNGAQTIGVQLKALANQQWSGWWEVVVVNNGSTDNSMEIVERYRDRLPNLRIVDAYTPPGPRLGVSHSYNTGMKAAKGDAFLFCEADDEVAHGWLVNMAEALSQYDFVACRLDFQQLNEPWRFEANGKGFDGLIPSHFPPYLPHAGGCSFGLKRFVYETVGGLDTDFRYVCDIEYCWRVQSAGIKLHFVPNAVIYYRLRHSLKAIYRQGYNWGKDFILLRKYYRSPFGKLTLVKRSLQFARSLPVGIWLFLQMRQQVPQTKSKFAKWLWDIGFEVGEFQGLTQRLPTSLKSKPAPSQPVPVLSAQSSL